MSLPVEIKDGHGSSNKVMVTDYGQLVVGAIDYSVPSVQELAVNDTGYVFIPPLQGKRIVITQMVLFSNKNVSATVEADVEIYESTTGSGTTVETSLLQVGLLKQTLLPLQLNLITSEGTWVMGKTSDDDVKVSIYYYYIPVD